MDESAEQQLEQAVDDIREWFSDHELDSFLERLAPGASAQVIAETEAKLGCPLPDAVRWFYARHDGQTGEVEPLFEHMFFQSLAWACELREELRRRYLIPPDGTPLRQYHSYHDYVSDDELRSPNWLPFANTEGDFLAVQLDSGRVYRFSKGDLPWIHFEAPSFADFIGAFASRLWDDVYQLQGDPEQPGVVEEGIICLSRYLSPA